MTACRHSGHRPLLGHRDQTGQTLRLPHHRDPIEAQAEQVLGWPTPHSRALQLLSIIGELPSGPGVGGLALVKHLQLSLHLGSGE